MAEEIYACEYCGKEYRSEKGLKGHLKICEYRPDADDDDAGFRRKGASLILFDDDEVDSAGEDSYCCPCGYESPKKFRTCPDCGEELEWD